MNSVISCCEAVCTSDNINLYDEVLFLLLFESLRYDIFFPDKAKPRLSIRSPSPPVARRIRQILSLEYELFDYARARIRRQYNNLQT